MPDLRRPILSERSRLASLVAVRLARLHAVASPWTKLLLAAWFVLAVLVVLLRYPIGQDSDGLIQTLFSIQRMTLFFWGQDRFANLLPALTMWITDPTINALTQLALRVALAVASPLFFCVIALPGAGGGAAWRATMVSTALLLAFAPQRTIFELCIEASPYGSSFALAGLALLAFQRGATRARHTLLWRCVGLALVVAAYLVNASLVLVALPVVLGGFVLLGSSLALEFAFASLVAGLATILLAKLVDDGQAPTSFRFFGSLAGVVGYGGQFLGKPGRFIVAMVLLALGVLALEWRRASGEVATLAARAATLAGALVVSFIAVASSDWVILNNLHPRYLVPTYVLAASVGGVFLPCVWSAWARTAWARDSIALVVSAALLVVAGSRGLPSPELRGNDIVSAPYRAAAAALAASVRERALDGIVGEYADVWPAVFQAEQVAHDLGEAPGRVFGVTIRGEARRGAFIARLLQKRRLQFACINTEPGWCNALLLQIMRPPQVAVRFSASREALPDGRPLTFFSIERPGATF